MIEFARLVNQASDEDFNKEIGSYLDVDRFPRFVAVDALLVNLDSLLSMGHNYYLYLNPRTNQFVFIPWDLDLSLASFGPGSPEQRLDLSLTHPHVGDNKLIDRLLAIKDVRQKYQKILQGLARTCFSREKLLEDLGAIEKVLKTGWSGEEFAREEGYYTAPGRPRASACRSSCTANPA